MSTTGNAILLFIAIAAIHSLQGATLSLKITDLDNNFLKEAGAGQPFLLHVIAKEVSNTAQYPDIKGIENIHIRSAGFQMNMINGTTSITYQYRVRIDTPGSYTLGPAQIIDNHTLIASEPINIVVSSEQKYADHKRNAATQAHNTNSFLRLTCAHDHAFVGQKVPCALTFFTPDANVVLESLIDPDGSQQHLYHIKNKKEPITGTQWINGVEYRYAQWQWDIYPLKPGPCTIPAYGAYYNNKSQRDMISLFFARPEQKRLYSNSVTISIEPLPDHAKNSSSLIGTIVSYSAHAEPHKTALGQAIVLTLTAIGTVDFEALGVVPLHSMPQQLKWYESKHTQEPPKTHDGFTKHTMEYIIQGLEEGVWHIPSQELTYFDPQECTYKNIKTQPMSVTITPALHANTPYTNSNSFVTTSSVESDVFTPLQENKPVAPLMKGLPLPLFWAIICLTSIAWFMITFYTTNKYLFTRFKKCWHKAMLFSKTRKHINTIQKNNRYKELYPTFINLIATWSNTPNSQVTPEHINRLFAARGMLTQHQQEWRSFIGTLLETTFYTSPLSPLAQQQLTEQALHWITVIEKLS